MVWNYRHKLGAETNQLVNGVTRNKPGGSMSHKGAGGVVGFRGRHPSSWEGLGLRGSSLGMEAAAGRGGKAGTQVAGTAKEATGTGLGDAASQPGSSVCLSQRLGTGKRTRSTQAQFVWVLGSANPKPALETSPGPRHKAPCPLSGGWGL